MTIKTQRNSAESGRITLFLGAGSSRPSGLPDLRGLFEEFHADFQQSNNDSTLAGFYQTIRGILLNWRPDLNIEQLLGCLKRLATPSTDPLFNFMKTQLPVMDPAMSASLSTLLSSRIELFIQHRLRKGGPTHELENLMKALLGYQPDFPLEIFTTNYDLCVEQACVRLGVKYSDLFPPDQPASDPLTQASADSRVLIHKLHGSINWFLTNSGRYRKFEIEPSSLPVTLPETSEKADLFLVYPAFEKPIYHRPITYFLERFRESLRKAEYLIIIGSSLSDEHIYHLLSAQLQSDYILEPPKQNQSPGALPRLNYGIFKPTPITIIIDPLAHKIAAKFPQQYNLIPLNQSLENLSLESIRRILASDGMMWGNSALRIKDLLPLHILSLLSWGFQTGRFRFPMQMLTDFFKSSEEFTEKTKELEAPNEKAWTFIGLLVSAYTLKKYAREVPFYRSIGDDLESCRSFEFFRAFNRDLCEKARVSKPVEKVWRLIVEQLEPIDFFCNILGKELFEPLVEILNKVKSKIESCKREMSMAGSLTPDAKREQKKRESTMSMLITYQDLERDLESVRKGLEREG